MRPPAHAVLLLIVTVAATASAVAASNPKHHSVAPPATITDPTTPPVTTTARTTTQATTTTAPATTTTTTTTTTAPPPVPPATGRAGWPAGTDGYTDVLESIPLTAGRGLATARAAAAAHAGLPQVGVLVSSDFRSLRAGYYVVFSGVYASSAAATAGLGTARSGGFAGAYQVRVAR
jgi:cytoskeletal protein RodZ